METQIITLESVKASMLPELQGWKEKQEAVVKENPFILITDNKTYEEAKKSRTTYVSARTTIEKQDKLIASKLKVVRDEVSSETKKLVDITLPHEEKQQNEVRRYEAIKEAERVEKEKIEKERKDGIQKNIEALYQYQKSKIDKLLFSDIDVLKADLEDNFFNTDTEAFEEFDLQFASKVQLIKQQLEDKIKILTEKENQRIEAEKLAKEKAEFEAQKKAKEEADKKEAKEREEKQKEIDAENKRKSDELEAQKKAQEESVKKEKEDRDKKQKEIDLANAKKQEELDAKQKAIDEAEAKRKAEVEAKEKAEADKTAKEKAEKEAKEKEVAEQKRLEELKPDREKALSYIESLRFTADFPTIENKEISKTLQSIRDGLNTTIIEFNNQILTIK